MRDIFLKEVWKPYPKVFTKNEEFIFGRVKSVGQENVVLICDSKEIEVVGSVEGNSDVHFGKSIPKSFLENGDVVAFDKVKRNFYLLSPNLSGCNIKVDDRFLCWSGFLDEVEKYFLNEAFFKARTPFLVESPGVDHHIDFLKVEGCKTKRVWSLPTSPEIHLKKLLCSGFEKVFEIKSCFRDDLCGPHHNVEFTMLEWYRSFVTLDDLVKDLENLIGKVSQKKLKISKVFLSDRFFETTGFKLSPHTTLSELKECASVHAIEFQEDDDWNDVFFRIYMEKVEQTLGRERPEVVFNFPPQQASLAQLNDEGWAERFELYWNGVELANAYCEVNDPWENKRRFEGEQELRKKAQKEISSFDEDFFMKLKDGMPPSCGIAMGLDRLYMLIRGDNAI